MLTTHPFIHINIKVMGLQLAYYYGKLLADALRGHPCELHLKCRTGSVCLPNMSIPPAPNSMIILKA